MSDVVCRGHAADLSQSGALRDDKARTIAMGLRLIKIGGSVITRDGCEGLFDEENTRRIACEIHSHSHDCILVHGTGLVGKRLAVENGYVKTGRLCADESQLGVTIRRSLRELNGHFIRLLLDSGIPALPMSTEQCFGPAGDRLQHGALGQSLVQATCQGVVPVFCGDFVPQSDGSFQVISSDAIMSVLVRTLRPAATYMFTDADGVYGRSLTDPANSGSVIPVLTESNVEEMYRSVRDTTDVSGGMGGKVRHAFDIARHCATCIIASGSVPGVVAKVLAGDDVVCTRVEAN